jgi:hypothetical protein
MCAWAQTGWVRSWGTCWTTRCGSPHRVELSRSRLSPRPGRVAPTWPSRTPATVSRRSSALRVRTLQPSRYGPKPCSGRRRQRLGHRFGHSQGPRKGPRRAAHRDQRRAGDPPSGSTFLDVEGSLVKRTSAPGSGQLAERSGDRSHHRRRDLLGAMLLGRVRHPEVDANPGSPTGRRAGPPDRLPEHRGPSAAVRVRSFAWAGRCRCPKLTDCHYVCSAPAGR